MVFEYQGQQYYYDAHNLGPQWAYQERDMQKKAACAQKNITLIEIPYWWDFQEDSLRVTIHKYHPDLVDNSGSGVILNIKEPTKGFPTSN